MPIICVDTRNPQWRRAYPRSAAAAIGQQPTSLHEDEHLLVVMHNPTPRQAWRQMWASIAIFMRASLRAVSQYLECIDRAHIATKYSFRERSRQP